MSAPPEEPTEPAALGSPCAQDLDCESELCSSVGLAGTLLCTQACDDSTSCTAPVPRCAEDMGLCAPACESGSLRGEGAAVEVCQSGEYVVCADLDPASGCTQCGGCEAFGGGVCVAGQGCVEPLADGEECGVDGRCASGYCYRDTRVCGAPREMGETCAVDTDCASSNCSNDGDTSVDGICNQPLGTACTRNSETCSRCMLGSFGDSGVCSRTRCSRATHPNCPTYRDHTWECGPGQDGRYYCYERCPANPEERDFYRCYDSLDACYSASSYCQ